MGNVQQYIGRQDAVGGHNVKVLQYLGEGGSSFIFVVVDTKNSKKLILKRMLADSSESMKSIKREIELMQQFSYHPNVVKYYDSQLKSYSRGKQTEVLVLMEYCERGHLLDELKRIGDKKLDEKAILCMFQNLCKPVYALHSHDPPVAHRDLKLENYLISQNNTYKLCDFGSAVIGSRNIQNRSERNIEKEIIEKSTSPMYRAPELADIDGHAMFGEGVLTEKVDIWALGCILYTLAFMKPPFEAEGLRTDRYKIPSDSRFSQKFHTLIDRMLTSDVNDRADIQHVMSCTECLIENQPLPTLRGTILKKKSKKKERKKIPISENLQKVSVVEDLLDFASDWNNAIPVAPSQPSAANFVNETSSNKTHSKGGSTDFWNSNDYNEVVCKLDEFGFPLTPSNSTTSATPAPNANIFNSFSPTKKVDENPFDMF